MSRETIEEALEVERLDTDLYRSVRLWKPAQGRGAFGGQVIGQALWAATQSVDEQYHLNSLHAYFLSFGDVSMPIVYHIERLRQGRSYCSRAVKAVQRGQCIFYMIASFHVPEPEQTRVFQVDAPNVPGPENCRPIEDRMEYHLNRADVSDKARQYLRTLIDDRKRSSTELLDAMPKKPGETGKDRAAWWMKCNSSEKRPNHAFQKCILAYISDLEFIGTASKALGVGDKSSDVKLQMVASLDHSMQFYNEDYDVTSEHILFDMSAEAVSRGRGTVTGRMYTKTGQLAVVLRQEGVIRLGSKEAAKEGAKL